MVESRTASPGSVASDASRSSWFARALFGALRALVDLYGVQQERAQLRDLESERLRDLGLHRAQAMRESARPFWQGRHTAC